MIEVGIILGSDSDIPKIEGCFSILKKFEVEFEVVILSAHRTPEKTKEWVETASERGIKIIIAVAGGAAHLPGVVASYTTLPVIGVPIETNLMGGLDSVFSILQMPAGIPVATMPVGKSGGINAALYSIKILSLINPEYQEKIMDYRREFKQSIEEKNIQLNLNGYENFLK